MMNSTFYELIRLSNSYPEIPADTFPNIR